MRPRSHGLFLALMVLCTSALAVAQAASPHLNPLEAKIAASVDAHNVADLALLERLVNINSGTMNLPGVIAVKDVVAPQFESLGFKVTWAPMESVTHRAGDLIAIHACAAGTGHCGTRLLLIGHMDTVFEPSSTFQKYSIVPNTDGKIATGPGIADMKGAWW